MARGGYRVGSGTQSGWKYPSGTEHKTVSLPVPLLDAIRQAKAAGMTGVELEKKIEIPPGREIIRWKALHTKRRKQPNKDKLAAEFKAEGYTHFITMSGETVKCNQANVRKFVK